MIEREWEYLLNLTSKIKDKDLAAYTKAKLEATPMYFRSIAASQSGKFHPLYALGDGGLVRHTIVAVLIGLDIVNLEYFQFKQTDKDAIISGLILHDSRKCGNHADSDGFTRKDHPKLAADTVMDDYPEVGRNILAHMGEWGNNKPGNLKQFCTHLADYIGSRRLLDVDFKKLIPEKVDKNNNE